VVEYRRLAFAGVVVGLGAIAGLFWLVNQYPPSRTSLFAFFPLVFLASAGMACPVMAFLNRRFAGAGHVGDAVRQSLWVGLVVAFCLWLRVMGAFSWPVAVTLAAVFLLIELFIRRARQGS